MIFFLKNDHDDFSYKQVHALAMNDVISFSFFFFWYFPVGITSFSDARVGLLLRLLNRVCGEQAMCFILPKGMEV